MIDPSIREKYNISYLRTYIRPDVNNRPKSVIETIYLIIAGLIFFLEPLLIMLDRNMLYPIIAVWVANLVIFIIFGNYADKKTKIEDMLDVSLVQEFVLTDKATGKKHPAYALIRGYNMIMRGTAEAAAMAAYDEKSILKYILGNESERKYYAALGKKIRNVKEISKILHKEDVQQSMADMIVGNKGFFRDMDYIFFDTYRPLKKKYKGRYYAVPGYRGIEQKILIPTDCGFEEAIKDDMDFVYYKNA